LIRHTANYPTYCPNSHQIPPFVGRLPGIVLRRRGGKTPQKTIDSFDRRFFVKKTSAKLMISDILTNAFEMILGEIRGVSLRKKLIKNLPSISARCAKSFFVGFALINGRLLINCGQPFSAAFCF
jgi:hypothetical protein